MNNNYENIVPWNGGNDTGRDVRLKLERNFAKIGLNFNELSGKFSTVDEMFEVIAKELENRLRNDQEDQTDFLLKLLGGALIKNGLTVDSVLVKSDLTARQLRTIISTALAEESDQNDVLALDLIEEGDGNEEMLSLALSEESTPSGYTSTLGELYNVGELVDEVSNTDMILHKSRGSTLWREKNISELRGKDGVIAYPTMRLNALTGRLILSVPTNNYENRFKVKNGHLMLIQNDK